MFPLFSNKKGKKQKVEPRQKYSGILVCCVGCCLPWTGGLLPHNQQKLIYSRWCQICVTFPNARVNLVSTLEQRQSGHYYKTRHKQRMLWVPQRHVHGFSVWHGVSSVQILGATGLCCTSLECRGVVYMTNWLLRVQQRLTKYLRQKKNWWLIWNLCAST